MRNRLIIIAALFLLAALPLAGQAWLGFPEHFFTFPPLIEHPPVHASFSWPVFTVFAAIAFLAAGIFLFPGRCGFRPPRPCVVGESVPPSARPRLNSFPLHGWFGLALVSAAWICAWGRFPLPDFIARHTFFLLWLGFIFTVDGLVFRRQGHSLFATRRRVFLALFPVSALSWWYFELLNRIVQNWWYLIPMKFGPAHYILYSTLCFSTVIPAIFEVRDLLATFPALRHRWSNGPRIRLPGAAPMFTTLGLLVLPLIPRFPDPLFFATWVAPLALLAGALGLARIPSPYDSLKRGDWSPVLLLACAALVCGCFWEMWNFASSPRWAYAVPYVNRFHLFEMPAVGYAGYLPFGPVCACFWLAWTALLPARLRPALRD